MSIRSLQGSVTRHTGPWIEGLARVGFGAKGLLYLLIGGLAAVAAVRGSAGDDVTDSHGVLETVDKWPFGRVILVVLACGLIGHAVWRVIAAIGDHEAHGKDAKGLAVRISGVLRGAVYAVLGVSAAKIAIGSHGAASSGDTARHGTARLLEMPGGAYLVGALAAGFVGYGLYQLYRAFVSKLGDQLSLSSLSRPSRRVVVAVSRFGIAARGIVFATIGVLLVRAAFRFDAHAAGGSADSLREILRFSTWAFLIVAVGLIAYGVFEFVNARFRRIRV